MLINKSLVQCLNEELSTVNEGLKKAEYKRLLPYIRCGVEIEIMDEDDDFDKLIGHIEKNNGLAP
jgi:hypothetical protein